MTITYLNDVVLITGEDVMEVVEIIEHESGGATIKVDMTKEEASTLIEYALQDLLVRAAKETIQRTADGSAGQ